MNNKDSHNVFVYGTLKKGGKLHHYMKEAEFTGEASLKGYALWKVSWYPAIVKVDNPSSIVYGEVYSVSSKQLLVLDGVEGFDREVPEQSLFIRTEDYAALLKGDEKIRTNLYVYNKKIPHKESTRITNGIWQI